MEKNSFYRATALFSRGRPGTPTPCENFFPYTFTQNLLQTKPFKVDVWLIIENLRFQG